MIINDVRERGNEMEINCIKDRRNEGDTTLRQTQLTQLYLLEVFDAICKEYGIEYFLTCGTLLGALRHKGFIPWDDDLDVGMTRRQYRRFLNVAPKCLPRNIMLQTPSSVPGAFSHFGKLRDLSSLFVESESNMTEPSGIFIDIFPYDKMPQLPPKLAHLWLRGISTCWRKSRWHRVSAHRNAITMLWGAMCSAAWATLRVILRLCGVLFMWLPRRWHCEPEIGGISAIERGIPDEEIWPLAEAEFEGRKFPVPCNSDAVLTRYYGAWREFPPENERQGHHSHLVFPMQSMGFWWAVKR